MYHESFGKDFVSLNDVLRACFPNNPNASITTIGGQFLVNFTNNTYENIPCFRADASDKTKHILVELDIVLQVFASNELKKFAPLVSTALSGLMNKSFQNLETICCCCPKKLKKAFIQSETFSDFVRSGPVVLNSFNAIKHTISYIACLDIEAFEHDHTKILEMGLAVYDVNSRTSKAYHLIIDDHAHLSNGKYIANNRDRFNFGTSNRLRLSEAVNFIFTQLNQLRTCLVGHNIKADIQFLRQISSQKINLPVFDTQTMHMQHCLSMQASSLSKLLDELNINYSNLHNAGNDAYYTLEAFIALAKV